MEKYELVLVLPGNTEKSSQTTLQTNLKKVLATIKAKLVKEEDWGVKKMAYPIKKTELGQYLFWHIQIDKAKIKELHRLLNFETKLLRYMLLKI